MSVEIEIFISIILLITNKIFNTIICIVLI